MNKFINVCGFGNTGCTAQADFLADYEGVQGILTDKERNLAVTNAPYQEFGILKCLYSFGGVLISKLHKLDIIANKAQLKASLIGELPDTTSPLNAGALLHLKKRKAVSDEYGYEYKEIVNQALNHCPDDFEPLSILESLEVIKIAFLIWSEGVYKLNQRLALASYGQDNLVLGLKNDPTGAYPLLSSIITNGLTSAILRNPFDTSWDFNRHYKIENTRTSIEWHCNHYNSQINSARSQILNFREQIEGHYFVHEFESFVSSDSHRMSYLKKMVGNRPKTNAYYDPEVSARNVDIYNSMDKALIQIIKDNCLDNYLDFKKVLSNEGLFFKGTEK